MTELWGSYGGFMTSWIISHHPSMFKSATVERALLNWETMVGTSDIGIGFPEMYLLDDMDKNINLYSCLLYTSPSPRDGLLSRMPSSA